MASVFLTGGSVRAQDGAGFASEPIERAARAASPTAGLPLGPQRVAFAAPFGQTLGGVAPHGAGAVAVFVNVMSFNGRKAITVQRLSPTGLGTGAPIHVTSTQGGGGDDPHIAALSHGGFVVVWIEPDSAGANVWARRYDRQSRPLGDAIRVNVESAGSRAAPRVAPLPNGGFAVVWRTLGPDGTAAIDLRRVSGAGEPLDALETRVNTGAVAGAGRPDLAAWGAALSIVWPSEPTAGRYDVAARLFNGATGAPITGEFVAAPLRQVSLPAPAIAARAGVDQRGGFALAYEAVDAGGATDIAVRLMSTTGVTRAAGLANRTTAGAQATPALTALKGGAFAVAFRTPSGAAGGTTIGLRVFDRDGVAIGHDRRVSALTANAESRPTLAATGLGVLRGRALLAAWTTIGPFANGEDIAGRGFRGP